MARFNLTNARVLVTGASSGIGRALALQLADRGARLLLTARRKDRLQELVSLINHSRSAARAIQLAGDITDAGHRDDLITAALEDFNGLDVLINNAGVGAIGAFQTASSNRLREIMEVNFFSAAELSRLSIPLLKRNERSMIVNVGSVLAFYAVPKKSEYCASKFALKGLSDALRIELRKDGISVLAAHPNTTTSEFFDSLIEKQGTAATNPMSATPQHVADQIILAMEKGKQEVVMTASGKTMIWLTRFFPRMMQRTLQRFG